MSWTDGVWLTRSEDVPDLVPRLVRIERPAGGWPVLAPERLTARLEALAGDVDLETLKDEPTIRAYRDLYWSLGIDPTKQRPSAEALLRRVQAGKRWPRIHPVVDAYNLVSAEQGVAIGGYDLDALRALAGVGEDEALTIHLRRALFNEPFLGIGMQCHRDLRNEELVLDAGGAIFALYPYRDGHRTRLMPDTAEALMICCDAPGLPSEALDTAAEALREALGGDPQRPLDV